MALGRELKGDSHQGTYTESSSRTTDTIFSGWSTPIPAASAWGKAIIPPSAPSSPTLQSLGPAEESAVLVGV